MRELREKLPDSRSSTEDDDGYIDEESPGTAAERRLRYLAVALFFLGILIASGTVDVFYPIAPPRPMGEEATRQEERRNNAIWRDGSKAQWLEESYRRTSRVRQWTLPTYTHVLMNGLGHVRKDLVLGRRGWLFLRHRVSPSEEDDATHLDRTRQIFKKFHQRSQANGHRLVVLPIPRKAAIVPEYLPPSEPPRADLDRQIPTALLEEGVEVVDILPLLDRLHETWGESPYYQGDSHLTRSAMLESAERVAHYLNLWVEPNRRSTTLQHLGPQPARGDLLELAGIRPVHSSKPSYEYSYQLDFRVLDGTGQPLHSPTDHRGEATIAVIGTSFSARSGFALYLSHFIDQPVLDLSSVGQNPLDALDTKLARRATEKLPEIILLEVPNFFLLDLKQIERHWPDGGIPTDSRSQESPGIPLGF